MRLPASFVLPLLVGAAQAASETAKVYIFQDAEYATTSKIPTLTPEEARLVIAQRLGVSRYHSLSDASKDTLRYIDAFGGVQKELFAEAGENTRSQRVTIIDSAASDVIERYQKEWAQSQLAFEISDPTISVANQQLVRDLIEQGRSLDVNYDRLQKSSVAHFQAADVETDTIEIQKFASRALAAVKNDGVDLMIIVIPESSESSSGQYGLYDMPLRSHKARSVQIEELIEEVDTSANDESNVFSVANDTGKKNGTVPFSTCYSRNDTCQDETRNCSGHGQCYRRYKSEEADGSCYTCGCKPSINITLTEDGSELARFTYWGGAACQKQDVSSPFWLIVGLTVVLIGTVSAGIGMLFSIGEEKLPSVIGAGVSGSKR